MIIRESMVTNEITFETLVRTLAVAYKLKGLALFRLNGSVDITLNNISSFTKNSSFVILADKSTEISFFKRNVAEIYAHLGDDADSSRIQISFKDSGSMNIYFNNNMNFDSIDGI